MSQAITISAPKTLADPLAERAASARAAYNAMQACADQMGAWAIVLGMEFAEAKKALGETRGGDRKSDNPDQSSGIRTFDQWREQFFPEVSRTQSYEYIRIARETKAGMIKSGSEAFASLLHLAPSQLSDEQRALLHKEVKGFADGRTLNQLMLDFGLVKKGRKAGKGTGNNGAETKRLNKGEPEPGWSQEEWEDYCDADDEERDAIDKLRPIEIGILAELEAGTLAHLPERFRANLAAAALKLTGTLGTMEKRKKGVRK